MKGVNWIERKKAKRRCWIDGGKWVLGLIVVLGLLTGMMGAQVKSLEGKGFGKGKKGEKGHLKEHRDNTHLTLSSALQ
jgi:hypothetical protein